MVAVPAWRPEHDPLEAVVALEEVRDLFRRPEWHARAACRGQDQERFFSSAPVTLRRAAAEYCARCPVTAECLAAGMGEDFGLWGGLTTRERWRLG